MTKVHLPRPTTGGFLTDPLPLFCGKARDLDTHTTSFPHRATCERCIAAHQRYTEESDYQLTRAKRSAETEREAGVAERVHYSRNTTPGITGLARAICGQWSQKVTDNAERVDCLACLRILKPTPKKARAPEIRKGGAVHYLTAGTRDADGRAQGHCRVFSDKVSANPTDVTCLRCMTVTRRNALVQAAALITHDMNPDPTPNKTERHPMTMTRFATAALLLTVAACDTLPTTNKIDADQPLYFGANDWDKLGPESDADSTADADAGDDESTASSTTVDESTTTADETTGTSDTGDDTTGVHEFELPCPGSPPCTVDSDCLDVGLDVFPNYNYPVCYNSECRLKCFEPYYNSSCGFEGHACQVDAWGWGNGLCSCYDVS